MRRIITLQQPKSLDHHATQLWLVHSSWYDTVHHPDRGTIWKRHNHNFREKPGRLIIFPLRNNLFGCQNVRSWCNSSVPERVLTWGPSGLSLFSNRGPPSQDRQPLFWSRLFYFRSRWLCDTDHGLWHCFCFSLCELLDSASRSIYFERYIGSCLASQRDEHLQSR